MADPISINLHEYRHNLEPSTIIWSAVRSIGITAILGLLGIAAGLTLLWLAFFQRIDADWQVVMGLYGFVFPITGMVLVFVSSLLAVRSIRDKRWVARKFLHQPYDISSVKEAILERSTIESISLKDVAELLSRAELTKTITELKTASGQTVDGSLQLEVSKVDTELPLQRTRHELRFSPSTEILTVTTSAASVPATVG